MTFEEIKKIVSLQLGIRKLNETDFLIEDLGAESADIINIVSIVEEKYHVVIEEEEIPSIKTINDLFNLIKKIKKAK